NPGVPSLFPNSCQAWGMDACSGMTQACSVRTASRKLFMTTNAPIAPPDTLPRPSIFPSNSLRIHVKKTQTFHESTSLNAGRPFLTRLDHFAGTKIESLMPFWQTIATKIYGLAIILFLLTIGLAVFLLFEVTRTKQNLTVVAHFDVPLTQSVARLDEAGLRRRLAFERWFGALNAAEPN